MASSTRHFGLRHPAAWLVGMVAALILSTTAAVMWFGSLPPRIVVMSTGQPGSDYAVLATRYRAILQRSGVERRLLPSAGDLQNLQRLSDSRSGVAVGLAQGGLTSEAASSDLRLDFSDLLRGDPAQCLGLIGRIKT